MIQICQATTIALTPHFRHIVVQNTFTLPLKHARGCRLYTTHLAYYSARSSILLNLLRILLASNYAIDYERSTSIILVILNKMFEYWGIARSEK